MTTSGRIGYYPSPYTSSKEFGLELDWTIDYIYINPGARASVTVTAYLVYSYQINSSSTFISMRMTDMSSTLDSTTSFVDTNANNERKRIKLKTVNQTYTLSKLSASSTVFDSKTILIGARLGFSSQGSYVKYKGVDYTLNISDTQVVIDAFDVSDRIINVYLDHVTKNSATFIASSESAEELYNWQYFLDDGSYTTFSSIRNTSTSYTIENLSHSTEYLLKIKGQVYGDGHVHGIYGYSDVMQFTTESEIIPVLSLSISDNTGDSITISAVASVPCYNWKYTINGTTYNFSNSGSILVRNSQKIENLSPDTEYAISVTATSYDQGVTATSDAITVMTNGPTTFSKYSYSLEITGESTQVIPLNLVVSDTRNVHDVSIGHDDSGTVIEYMIASRQSFSTGTNNISLNSDAIAWIIDELGENESATFSISIATYNSTNELLGEVDDASLLCYTSNSILPLFSDFTYRDRSEVAVNFTGNDQYFVQGYSSVTVDASSAEAGAPGISLVGYTASFGDDSGTSTSPTVYIPVITRSGTLPLTVSVSDSRGQSTTVSKAATSLAYSSVKIISSKIEKASGKLSATISGEFTSVKIENVEKNDITSLYFEIRKTDDVVWSDPVYVSPTKSGTVFTFSSADILDNTGIVMDPDYSYYIRFVVSDRLTTDSYQNTIMSDVPLMSYRKGMVGINNKYPNAALDVIGEIEMNGFNVQGFVRTSDNESLNTILDSGIYLAEWESGSTSVSHYPVAARGVLEVLPELDGVTQRFTKIPVDGRMWIRNGSSSSFGEWKQIAGSGTFVQEQADWLATDITSPSYIRNKPTTVPWNKVSAKPKLSYAAIDAEHPETLNIIDVL